MTRSAGLAPRAPWRGRRVLLGVSGGIAAYKSAQIARDLTLLGADVDVLLTSAAGEFVRPLTFEALTGRPVHTNVFQAGDAALHIRLAREADVVCVAPATADLLARHAAGMANDLLSAVLLATRAPVLLCPAMNGRMWQHPATRANVETLRGFGHRIAGPAEGALAHGEEAGIGRMLEPELIVEHVARALAAGGPLDGRRVVVTAGPTREAVDAVRVLSNRSSGRMGFALAAEAWRRGADVRLVSGPASVHPPLGMPVTAVESAAEMEAAVRDALADADVLIMSAAVADFRPVRPDARKMKKEAGPPKLELEPAPDVLLATRGDRPPGLVTVGFALETDDAEANARRKLESKGLDLVVLNRADAAAGSGFEVDTNRVTLVAADGDEALPLMGKDEVAGRILDRVERLLERGASRADTSAGDAAGEGAA